MKARIFISCGQRDDNEVEIANQLEMKLKKLDFEPYLAIEQHSLSGFTENILPQLEKSEYYLMIDFKRERIKDNEFRGSLFTHQELAIATFLKKEHILVFQEIGVRERDGIMKFIQCNPISFSERNTLIELILENIRDENWHPNWRNELEMVRANNELPFISETFFGPTTWYHIKVNNNHDKKIASNCVAYLLLIRNLDSNVETIPELVEFKWKGVITQSVTIPPGQFRYLDAFSIIHDSQNIVYLSFNRLLTDTNVFLPSYTLCGPSNYQLEFVIYSTEFQPIRKQFNLRIGTTTEDIKFDANE